MLISLLISVDIYPLEILRIKVHNMCMTNLSPIVCKKIKEARRNAGLSQSEIAKEINCKQSALSMFEQGDGTKLNDEAIEKLCAKFSIDLEGNADKREAAVVNFSVPAIKMSAKGYCPNPKCPTNHRYEVETKVYYLPDRDKADPVGGKYCAMCGEILEHVCPNCGAPIHDGAICSICGEPYIV